MAIQKLIKVGNSYAVTIPMSIVKKWDLKPGDEVEVTYNKKLKKIILHFEKDTTSLS
jgi:antitoxin component of MazEF toxin-antitoxin module